MASRFYRYADLVAKETTYARRMAKLSRQIFHEPAKIPSQKSMKVLKILSDIPYEKRFQFTHWYPRHVETHQLCKHLRNYGLFRDEHQDFREEIQRLKRLRGKDWMYNLKVKQGKIKEGDPPPDTW